jgi:hypothetical protein
LSIDIVVKGPVLTGQAGVVVTQLVDDIVDRVAAYAIERVQHNLDGSIKNPTPYYETQIQITNVGRDRSVNDRGVIYGSWLESGGSRAQTTRFKGYQSFRRAAQSTEQAAQGLADSAVRRYLGRLG